MFVIILLLILPAWSAVGEWAISRTGNSPLQPDHEQRTTFTVSLHELNATPPNGTEGNGTGGNGTGRWSPPERPGGRDNSTGNDTGTNQTNGNYTGTNQTGTNGTGTNQTNGTVNVTVTGVQLVMGNGTNITRTNMSRINGTWNYTVTLGPWPPGHEFCYTYEANLSNGTVLRTNVSWLRTPELLSISWHQSFEEARALSSELGRPLMLYIYSDLLPDCRRMDEGALSSSAVISLSDRFVCARLSNDTTPSLGTSLGIRRLPAVVFFNSTSGNETDRFYGSVSGRALAGEMNYILKGGKRPSLAEHPVPEFRLEVTLLGASLIVAPLAMYLYFRFQKNR